MVGEERQRRDNATLYKGMVARMFATIRWQTSKDKHMNETTNKAAKGEVGVQGGTCAQIECIAQRGAENQDAPNQFTSHQKSPPFEHPLQALRVPQWSSLQQSSSGYRFPQSEDEHGNEGSHPCLAIDNEH